MLLQHTKTTFAVFLVVTALLLCGGCKPAILSLEPQNGSAFQFGEPITLTCSAFSLPDGMLSDASILWTSDRDGRLGTGSPLVVSGLSVGTHCITVRVTNDRGWHAYQHTSVSILGNQPPRARILSPQNGYTATAQEPIIFAGAASDPEDGLLDGEALTWESNRSGVLGAGASLTCSGLAAGTHLITLSARDSAGSSHSVGITIAVEGEDLQPTTTSSAASTSSSSSSTTSPPPATSSTTTTAIILPPIETTTSTTSAVFITTTTTAAPAWEPMELPAECILYDVWGTAADNVYAAGGDPKSYAGVILHFNSTTWSEAFRAPAGKTAPSGLFYAISGCSDTSIIATGGFSEGLQQQGIIYRFNGTDWSEAYKSGSMGTLSAAWCGADDDMLAGGGVALMGSIAGRVLAYNGSSWSLAFAGLTEGPFHDFQGESSANILAAGGTFDESELPPLLKGRILYSAGAGWTLRHEVTGAFLQDFWSDAAAVYAVGGNLLERSGGVVLRSSDSGATWQTVTVAGADAWCLNAVWGTASDNIYIVGDDGHRGAVFHFDGSAWSKTDSGLSPLYGIWGASAQTVFAVGDEAIYRYAQQ